jgi:glycosyltransferase involved in cell wall biosynthesis
MNILFVHNNFPAQFRHLAAALAKEPGVKLAAIGSPTAGAMAGVDLINYDLAPQDVLRTHAFARRFDIECRRAEQVLYATTLLSNQGFRPDVILVHSGWGENLPLRSAFPKARIVNYCEFYYRPFGQDVNFDPEFPELSLDGLVALATKNANGLLALIDCDLGIAPTEWQRSTFPSELRSKIVVAHDGVDVDMAQPDSTAEVVLPSGRKLRVGDEVVTYVARNLEPLRGYHIFMRALPEILRQRPEAQILVVGGDGVSYGAQPPSGATWKDHYLAEVAGKIDLRRVHFLGPLSYPDYLNVLRVSAAHIYLTYPFVLSWSMLEAMSVEARIIASDTAPVREILNEDCGTLTSFFDSEALAAATVAALREPAAYRVKATRARAKILSEFDARRICVPRLKSLLWPENPAKAFGT